MTEDRKLRVLLLAHEYSMTGAPKLILDLIESTQDEVEFRTVALRGGPLQPRFQVHGPAIVVSDVASSFRGAELYYRLTGKNRWAEWRAFAGRPDLIYVNSVAALEIARLLPMPRAPVLFHVHDMGLSLELTAKAIPTEFFDWPDRYLVVSEATRRSLVDRCGVEASRVELVHACIPDWQFDLYPFQEPPDEGRWTVGGAGQVNWRKGNELWLLMAQELARIVPRDKLRCAWIGVEDDEAGRQFRHMAGLMGVEDVVEFVPATMQPFKHYAQFDVFAMTSWMDPCPLVVLENMMLGRPVVCFSGGGGAAEEIGDTGLAIDRFDPKRMAVAIAELLADRDRRREMGLRARKRCRENFTLSVQAPKILNAMKRVAAK